MIRRYLALSISFLIFFNGNGYPQTPAEMFPSEIFQRAKKSYSTVDLGLMTMTAELKNQIQALWQMVQGRSRFEQIRFDWGPWKARREDEAFFLYHATSFQPLLRTFNNLGDPVIYPPLLSIIPMDEMGVVENDSKLINGYVHDPIASKLIALRKTVTYRSKRIWERSALEDNVVVGELFRQFESQTTMEEVIFEAPLSEISGPIDPKELEEIQQSLNQLALFRIHIVEGKNGEDGKFICTLRVPTEEEMKSYHSPAFQHDGLTLNDEHISAILLALGLNQRNVVKEKRTEKQLLKLREEILLKSEKLEKINPPQAGKLKQLLAEIGIQIRRLQQPVAGFMRNVEANANLKRHEILSMLWRMRANPRAINLARNILPNSKTFRALEDMSRKIRTLRKFPLATIFATFGIASLLMFDLTEAKKISENPFSNQIAYEKTVSAWIKAAYWSSLLWMGRQVKRRGVEIFAKRALAKIASVLVRATIALDVAHITLNQEIPTSDEIFDLGGAMATDFGELGVKYFNPNWAVQRWKKLIELKNQNLRILQHPGSPLADQSKPLNMTELMGGLHPVSTVEKNQDFKDYRLNPIQFQKESEYILASGKSFDEKKEEYETMLGRFARGYLQLTLATLQFAGENGFNRFLLGTGQTEAMMVDMIRTVDDHMKVLENLTVELNLFTLYVKRYSDHFTQKGWIDAPGETAEQKLDTQILRLVAEIKDGGRAVRVKGCDDLSSAKCWKVILDPIYVASPIQIEIGDNLMQIHNILKNKSALAFD